VSSARAPSHAVSGALVNDRSSPALFRVPTENRFDSILTRPTFAGASITQGDPPKPNQLLMALAVVLLSAVSSAVTTVLFLAPVSFAGLPRVFTGRPPKPANNGVLPVASVSPSPLTAPTTTSEVPPAGSASAS